MKFLGNNKFSISIISKFINLHLSHNQFQFFFFLNIFVGGPLVQSLTSPAINAAAKTPPEHFPAIRYPYSRPLTLILILSIIQCIMGHRSIITIRHTITIASLRHTLTSPLQNPISHSTPFLPRLPQPTIGTA